MKKVGIAVGGRFHSDFMYQSLVRLGHSTHLFTSLPKNRFSIPKENIWSFIIPELIFRFSRNVGLESQGDALKMQLFGKYLSERLGQYQPDLFVGWSSFSLETLQRKPAKFHILMRDSAHIKFQYDLLMEEYKKYGHKFPARDFCLRRENEEYSLADRIWVLSHFAKKTFVDLGVNSAKIDVLPLGVDLDRFKPMESAPVPVPLRLIYFGILSYRKGVQYLLEATKDFSPRQVELNLIGAVEPDFKDCLAKYSHFNYQGPMLQSELAKEIRKHHVFVFPTIEDGFGQTLIQAMASGLVPITTTHCGAADFTFLESAGLRVPARSSEQIKEKIEKLLSSPDLMFKLRQDSILNAQSLNWTRYEKRLSELVSH
ncbi:glycosyltransferase [bacterium]|nr:glycosyltransferase [bacterium]